MPELKNTIGDELLKVHVSYGPLVQSLVAKFNSALPASRRQIKSNQACRHAVGSTIKAFAHITGGGFVDNIPRVLPKTCDVVIRKDSWDMLPIFQLIAVKGGVPEGELYQVFNMGIGTVAIVNADKADAVLKFIKAHKHEAWLIGEVVKDKGTARVV